MRTKQPCGDRSRDLQLHPYIYMCVYIYTPDILTSMGDFSDTIGGDCQALSPMWKMSAGLGGSPPMSSQPQTPSLPFPLSSVGCSLLPPQLLSTPSRRGQGTGPKTGQMWGRGGSGSTVELRHPNTGEHPDG